MERIGVGHERDNLVCLIGALEILVRALDISGNLLCETVVRRICIDCEGIGINRFRTAINRILDCARIVRVGNCNVRAGVIFVISNRNHRSGILVNLRHLERNGIVMIILAVLDGDSICTGVKALGKVDGDLVGFLFEAGNFSGRRNGHIGLRNDRHRGARIFQRQFEDDLLRGARFNCDVDLFTGKLGIILDA